MDVFKLLSRSSKAVQAPPTHKLPSDGAAANPQLFGHAESNAIEHAVNKGQKRKRGQDTAEAKEELPAGLYFFGSAPKAPEAEHKADAEDKGCAKKEGLENETVGDRAEDQDSTDAYDEDECKRILRSHKLKIMVLEDFRMHEEDPQKEKKKVKKREREKEKVQDKKKNAKKQLLPQPLTSFAQLRSRHGISRRLADNLREQGYKVPTEVQLGALPLLLGKKGSREAQKGSEPGSPSSSGEEYGGDIDLLTIAPTGSGKTIAFLIPIINKHVSQKSDGVEGPRAVIIAPTRELASQIVNEARKLSKGTGIKAALMKKGMEVVERPVHEVSEASLDIPEVSEEEGSASDSENEGKVARLKKRTHRRSEKLKAAILVATPLALLNALKLRDDKIAKLPSVRHLVLDEADVLLDPLFREQTLAIWNACTSPLLRVGLWSATIGSNIEALAINTLNDRWSTLSSSNLPSRRPLIRLVVGLKDTAIPNITHQLTYAATEQGKLLGLRQLLHPTAVPSSDSTPSLRPPFLVFTQTIPRAIALHSELLYDIPPEAGGSSRIAVLHADLSSSARENIMTRFRRGEIWVLITTDLLARGVDFRGLNGVVNYDVPNSAAAYVHRVGRTGRAGREGGVAVTFYTQEDIPHIKLIANVIRASEKLRGKSEEEASVKQWLLDALPTPSKRDKRQLKKRGVEARRNVKDGEGKGKMRISTKSGYERRIENRRRGAKMAHKERGREDTRAIQAASESEFEGFE
ncbi:P-loop containing nucleoside triphosphate hydrolase protein [Trematosphaeria pertusa]|uniref:ATP-dependent RNA helicase ROK1 n=1 Tax=Trematosphaeria pertusa TaxID=390896 RepID=A0A6A6IAF8_9PLEO|nr:P-loop containing nucleoside triphosphate hydrolase protein [Trematosphaeria pertusa]KAF2246520.1 P-loop containing nucleoside triphosphate hydrolase protein [Trematosphaeria pertusa]